MTDSNRGKTMYCSVLFVDMVGYSKKTNSEQTVLKQQFVSSWEEALKNIPPEDIMVVDSGDGAALTALKDTEDTLRVAKILCKLLAQEQEKDPATQFQLRMGIHFGPVELSTDVHGKACIIGDAINVASRVMSFAGSNQLLVSRSYYDLIRPLSKANEEAFHFFGTHNDKHERPHELYEFVEPGATPSLKGAAIRALSDADRQVQETSTTAEIIEPPPVITVDKKNKDSSASFPGRLFSYIRSIFSNIWYRIKYILRVSVLLLIIYELFVLIPILDKPTVLKKELNQQAQSAKALFKFGNDVITDTSQTIKNEVNSGTSSSAKKPQAKTQP